MTEQGARGPITSAELDTLLGRCALLLDADLPDRIERVAALERLKHAICAAQARETVAVAAGRRAEHQAAGLPRAQWGRGVSLEIALARGVSVHRGQQLLGLAQDLSTELPETLRAMERGEVDEWKATVVARETACLDANDRRAVDTELASDLGAMSIGQARARVVAMSQDIDAAAMVKRAAKAVTDRRVTLRPAPDTMSWLSAMLPVKDGVAVFAALQAEVKRVVARGDVRHQGQIMADVLVERVTGRSLAEGVPLSVQLVMTDRALLGDDTTAAHVPGFGPVPADIARGWIIAAFGQSGGSGHDRAARDAEAQQEEAPASPTQATPTGAQRFGAGRAEDMVRFRRLWTSPDRRDLVAMESTSRCFSGLLRQVIMLRDQRCTTPWCDAPVRHVDHTERSADGGATSYHFGRGTCVTCNLARESPGWRVDVTSRPDESHEITITTPTGHTYRSLAPPLLPRGQRVRGEPQERLDDEGPIPYGLPEDARPRAG